MGDKYSEDLEKSFLNEDTNEIGTLEFSKLINKFKKIGHESYINYDERICLHEISSMSIDSLVENIFNKDKKRGINDVPSPLYTYTLKHICADQSFIFEDLK